MEALKIEPGKKPYVIDIDMELETLQNEVGGYIQAINPFDDPVAIICNEEGKLLNLEPNRAIYDKNGELLDILVGTFLIVGVCEDMFCWLTDELIEKYEKVFEEPEYYPF